MTDCIQFDHSRLHAPCSVCGGWPTEGQKVHVFGNAFYCAGCCAGCNVPTLPMKDREEQEPVTGEQSLLF